MSDTKPLDLSQAYLRVIRNVWRQRNILDGFSLEENLVKLICDPRYEISESTILWESQKGSLPSCQRVLRPQWAYIIRLTKGTEPKATGDIRLRGTGLDVLTKIEMFEKGLQKTDGLFRAPRQRGQKDYDTTCYMTLRSL